MPNDEHSVGCDELVEATGHVTGEAKAPNGDTARKEARKDALNKARVAADAAASTILDDYDCTDEDCPDPKITITYKLRKPKCKKVEEKDATTGLTETLRDCKARCDWEVVLTCVDSKEEENEN